MEALKRLVRVEGLPQLRVVCRKVRGQYPDVVAIEMADREER